MPVLLCPGCWIQLLFLGLLWLLLLFFAKICKFNWAIKTHSWCSEKLRGLAEAAKFWKKKESDCGCGGCDEGEGK